MANRLVTLWKEPFRVEVTEAVQEGENDLANQGDQPLAESSDR